jgi:hypothetical protein
MGTLSKRPLRDFGIDIKETLEGFRSSVGTKLDHVHLRGQTDAGLEGVIVRGFERVTNALPPSTWFTLSASSLVGAIALRATRHKHLALLVGQLVPTFLFVGLYNRLRVVPGDDRGH